MNIIALTDETVPRVTHSSVRSVFSRSLPQSSAFKMRNPEAVSLSRRFPNLSVSPAPIGGVDTVKSSGAAVIICPSRFIVCKRLTEFLSIPSWELQIVKEAESSARRGFDCVHSGCPVALKEFSQPLHLLATIVGHQFGIDGPRDLSNHRPDVSRHQHHTAQNQWFLCDLINHSTQLPNGM